MAASDGSVFTQTTDQFTRPTTGRQGFLTALGTVGATAITGRVSGADSGTDSPLVEVNVGYAAASGLDAGIAVGIEYVAEQDWDVANLRLGGPEPAGVLEDAVADATDRGVLLVR